jgi:hypothetical protein
MLTSTWDVIVLLPIDKPDREVQLYIPEMQINDFFQTRLEWVDPERLGTKVSHDVSLISCKTCLALYISD